MNETTIACQNTLDRGNAFGQADYHAILLAYALLDQPVRHARDAISQLAIGDAAVAAIDSQFFVTKEMQGKPLFSQGYHHL